MARARAPPEDEMPLRVCHLGQAAGAMVVAVAAGTITVALSSKDPSVTMGVIAGLQSGPQLCAQAVGAAVGAYAMAGIDYSNVARDLVGEEFSGVPRDPTIRTESGGPLKHLGVRLAGSSAGATFAWVAFPPGLDFSLVATSLLVAAAAVIAALVTESWTEAKERAAAEVPHAYAGVAAAEPPRVAPISAVPVGRGRVSEAV
mmetsp:Transcript_101886/g.263315  ORF Transcript_101886/g.263315 Transcript_101886/m.263315 type:complete len:202 (+) Transcript_101886:136-741(+)